MDDAYERKIGQRSFDAANRLATLPREVRDAWFDISRAGTARGKGINVGALLEEFNARQEGLPNRPPVEGEYLALRNRLKLKDATLELRMYENGRVEIVRIISK